VSRLHAKFSPVGARWAIEDLGSRNGTWVNGDRLARVRILRNGDEIRFATITVLFRDPTVTDEDTTKPKAVAPAVTPRERDVLIELCRPFFGANLLKRVRRGGAKSPTPCSLARLPSSSTSGTSTTSS
jgi:pSer/pThr/pTyr-binding forkhead associated (FHA) protein